LKIYCSSEELIELFRLTTRNTAARWTIQLFISYYCDNAPIPTGQTDP